MTNKEIVAKVESWNWNLNIFEIYDEVKDMYHDRFAEEASDLSRLLNHAYEYFKYESTMYELMSHLGVEIEEYNKEGLTNAS